MEEPDEFTPPPRPRGRRQAVAAESFDPSTADEGSAVVFHEKTDDQLKFLRDATSDILFFARCEPEQVEVLLNAMFERKVAESELIIKQGDVGDNLYIIQHGQYDIFVNKDDNNDKDSSNYIDNNDSNSTNDTSICNGSRTNGSSSDDDTNNNNNPMLNNDNIKTKFKIKISMNKWVATLDKGYFGELALLYNAPRNATIVAKTKGVLWGLDQKTFREIVVNSTARKREALEDLLKGVSMLDSLTQCELMDLTDALQDSHFEQHQCIIKEGDQADKMYFIMNGEASVKVIDQNTQRETEITRLKRGQYFGEFALVLNTPRVASVYVVSETMKCAVLDIGAFERLLGPCVEIMKRNIDNYERERKKLGIVSLADDCVPSTSMGNLAL